MFTKTRTPFVVLLLIFSLAACQKKGTSITSEDTAPLFANKNNGHLVQTKTFSSEPVVKWLEQQLNMFRLPLGAGVTAPSSDRAFAYSGIAVYEAVLPGMPSHRSMENQLNSFPQMPKTQPGKAYHWGASANAALASINRKLFSGASAANKQKMDSLEASLEAKYATETDAATLQRSIQFGRTVADSVWSWAQTDGTSTMPPASSYVIPTGPGLWEQTPPAFALPVNAFHHMRRPMVIGAREGAAAPALSFPFSTTPGSDYYNMAKEVYDASVSLTPEQMNIALYHREGLGYGGGSSIAGQLAAVIKKADAKLDKAAQAFIKVGIGTYEALTLTFIQKYEWNVMRPITYIRRHMGQPTWNTVYGTPAYPEYPAGHPTNGGMLAVMLTDVFGDNFSFDVDYYNYLGLPARHYNSFNELAQEMAIARFYAGIHYKPAVYAGVGVGSKVAGNILLKVRF